MTMLLLPMSGAEVKRLRACQCLRSKRRAVGREREIGMTVGLAVSDLEGQHCRGRRLQRPQQIMGPKMPSAAECCFLGNRD